MSNQEDFIPSGYEIPKSPSKYTKFEEGKDTEILPLASIIFGFEYWNKEGKPVRIHEMPEQYPADIRAEKDGSFKIKPFWAFPVWNFSEKMIQITQITQKTIMESIQALARNPKWGNPVKKYSITITREGEGLDTKYTVMPNPVEAISEDIMGKWFDVQGAGFDITRLFTGGDPFTPEDPNKKS